MENSRISEWLMKDILDDKLDKFDFNEDRVAWGSDGNWYNTFAISLTNWYVYENKYYEDIMGKYEYELTADDVYFAIRFEDKYMGIKGIIKSSILRDNYNNFKDNIVLLMILANFRKIKEKVEEYDEDDELYTKIKEIYKKSKTTKHFD